MLDGGSWKQRDVLHKSQQEALNLLSKIRPDMEAVLVEDLRISYESASDLRVWGLQLVYRVLTLNPL